MADRNREGYILLDRNILDWQWWQKHNTLIVFLWLLMKAQFHDSTFCGVKIKRGQVATTLSNIEQPNKMTRQEVRTAISNLKSTNAITIKRYSKFLVITIVNYEEYQDLTIKTTRKQHSSNNHLTIIQPHTNTYNTYNTKERRKSRSAPSLSENQEYACGKSGNLKPRDEGTVDDIPEIYKQYYKTYAEYYDARNT